MKKISALEKNSTSDIWWMKDDYKPEISGKLRDEGLSTIEASHRLQQYGSNCLTDSHATAAWVKFLAHFKNPLVLLLIAASTLSALVGEFTHFLLLFVSFL